MVQWTTQAKACATSLATTEKTSPNCNLLTVIMGRADLLPECESRAQILLASRQAAELTASLLKFGRKVPAHAQSTDVVSTLTKLEPMFRSLLGPQIELSIPVNVSSVLQSLVDDAVDAGESAVYEGPDHVVDAGPGIPEAERTRVLMPYVRLEGSRSG